MELLIPGLVLVAIMVWASTRIKRNAAAAFDAETVATDDFSVDKPAGWLSVVEPRDGYLFEAYTKDFGTNAAENIRRGTANVSVSDGSVDDRVSQFLGDSPATSDRREVIDGIHYRIVEREDEDADASYLETMKVAGKGGKVYTLTVTCLADATDEFRRGVEGMVDSFVLK
ncbi:MAG TPA: hypothetical protein VL501_09455 [Pyrinomonadaceae bacterium]|nr:hypothetical protein [Pyrinomonadaceae bacterium]